jgi:plasmid stability protein
MPSVLVRDLPDDVHTTLQQRAAASGQSLQQYLVGELTRLAARPTIADILAQIDALENGHVGFSTAVADLRAERPAS